MFTTTRLLAALAVIAGLWAQLFAPSLTFATLPSNELWRENLVKNVVGFGKNATGGKGGDLCRVTNLNDAGTGSLRACAEATGALWIVFDVSGNITLSGPILIQSNKTVDGRGADVTLVGSGFIVKSSNVILENLKFHNNITNGMILVMDNARDVWIDHNTFQNAVDEMLYVGSTACNTPVPPRNVTVSWNHAIPPNNEPVPPNPISTAWDNKAFLVSNNCATVDTVVTITMHHNHFQTYVRHPASNYATIHAFNDYYNKNTFGPQPCTSTKMYSENEVFERGAGSADPMSGSTPYLCGTGYDTASYKVLNPYLLSGATYAEKEPANIFNPSSYYSYTAEPANETLRQTIIAQAGWQHVTPPVGPTGPVAWYPLDGDTTDASGNGHTGTAVGGAPYTTGRVGQALSFDGIDDAVTIPAVSLGGSLTYAGWIKGSVWPGTAAILAQWGSLLEIAGSGTVLAWYPDVYASSVSTPYTFAANQWYHVAVTQTGTSYTLYVNGAAVTSGTTTAVRTTNFTNTIGSYGNGRRFNGMLDEVRIYNRVLAAQEIQELYQQDSDTQPPTAVPLAPPENLRVLQVQ